MPCIKLCFTTMHYWFDIKQHSKIPVSHYETILLLSPMRFDLLPIKDSARTCYCKEKPMEKHFISINSIKTFFNLNLKGDGGFENKIFWPIIMKRINKDTYKSECLEASVIHLWQVVISDRVGKDTVIEELLFFYLDV